MEVPALCLQALPFKNPEGIQGTKTPCNASLDFFRMASQLRVKYTEWGFLEGKGSLGEGDLSVPIGNVTSLKTCPFLSVLFLPLEESEAWVAGKAAWDLLLPFWDPGSLHLFPPQHPPPLQLGEMVSVSQQGCLGW